MRIDIVRGGLVALVALLVGGCPSKDDGLAPVASTPEEALTLANPRQTLKMLGLTHGPDEKLAGATEADRVLFAVASLDLDRWADAEVVVARVKDAAVRGILQCYLAGKRMDIDAERRCRDAITAAKTQTGVAPFLVDSAELGLAAAIERNNRLEAAAEVYEGLAKARPNVRNRKALHGFYDRVGWVKEDVVALEAWVQDAPNDPTVKATLRAALERKVKGDILEARGAEAVEAARRLIALEPDNGTWRYYLADALDLADKKEEAAKERAAAVASGAAKPKAPNAIREAPPEPHNHAH